MTICYAPWTVALRSPPYATVTACLAQCITQGHLSQESWWFGERCTWISHTLSWMQKLIVKLRIPSLHRNYALKGTSPTCPRYYLRSTLAHWTFLHCAFHIIHRFWILSDTSTPSTRHQHGGQASPHRLRRRARHTHVQ
jgi:hypothetical protein